MEKPLILPTKAWALVLHVRNLGRFLFSAWGTGAPSLAGPAHPRHSPLAADLGDQTWRPSGSSLYGSFRSDTVDTPMAVQDGVRVARAKETHPGSPMTIKQL